MTSIVKQYREKFESRSEYKDIGMYLNNFIHEQEGVQSHGDVEVDKRTGVEIFKKFLILGVEFRLVVDPIGLTVRIEDSEGKILENLAAGNEELLIKQFRKFTSKHINK